MQALAVSMKRTCAFGPSPDGNARLPAMTEEREDSTALPPPFLLRRLMAMLYDTLLADPTDADWSNDSLEALTVLTTDRSPSFENLNETVFSLIPPWNMLRSYS